MKLLGADWYTTKDGAIGIVFYKDDVGKLKARIGHTTGWVNEGADIRYILRWGAKFPTNAALELFGYSRITYSEGGVMDEKEIVKILKDEGLDIAEEMAVQAVKGAIKLIKEMLPKV
ncbi:MAG: hypothetical protein KJN62_06560, partial [Deltaproteobacteria bacterium]|nr:hypothetical protein [Deltaproteobacteria bacterium]